jgi:hypothetical protein
MRVLHVVHDISPSFQWNYQENGNPSKANVIKRDGSLKRILLSRSAICVVLVPVYATRWTGFIVWFGFQMTILPIFVTTCRKIVTIVHSCGGGRNQIHESQCNLRSIQDLDFRLCILSKLHLRNYWDIVRLFLCVRVMGKVAKTDFRFQWKFSFKLVIVRKT